MKKPIGKKRVLETQKDRKKIFKTPKKRSISALTVFLGACIVVLVLIGVKLLLPPGNSESSGNGQADTQGESTTAEPKNLANWTKMGQLKGEMQSMTIDPRDPSKIYLGTSGEGLAISGDGGSNWKYIGPAGATILDISADPASSGDIIMATITDGLVRVSGDRLTKLPGLPDREYHVAQVDPRDPNIVWAGLWLRGKTGPTLYISGDGGISWAPVTGGPQGSDINFVYFDEENRDTYVGTFGTGLFLTQDHGRTWSSMGSLPQDDITMMAFSADKKSIYVGTHGNGVLKSVDGGKSWEAVNQGKEAASDVHGLAADPKDTNTIYAAGMMMGRGVFKSADGGASWQPLDTGDINLEDVHIFQITPDEKSIILGSGEHGSGKGILYKMDLES